MLLQIRLQSNLTAVQPQDKTDEKILCCTAEVFLSVNKPRLRCDCTSPGSPHPCRSAQPSSRNRWITSNLDINSTSNNPKTEAGGRTRTVSKAKKKKLSPGSSYSHLTATGIPNPFLALCEMQNSCRLLCANPGLSEPTALACDRYKVTKPLISLPL